MRSNEGRGKLKVIIYQSLKRAGCFSWFLQFEDEKEEEEWTVVVIEPF